MAITIAGQVGPRTVQDGTATEMRQDRTGAVVDTPAHGQLYEPASRQRVYTISTALAGTTVVAANAAPPAAAAATILTLYNPMSSGVYASISKTVLNSISGTPGAGAFTYCVIWGTVIKAAQNAVPKCNYIGGANPACRGYTQTALTGGLVHQVLRPIGWPTFAGAIAATSPNLCWTDYVNGEIVLPQGTALTIANCATGTSHVMAAAITWEEVPL